MFFPGKVGLLEFLLPGFEDSHLIPSSLIGIETLRVLLQCLSD